MKNELWSIWNQHHTEPDQQKRIASAKKSSCTPLKVDFVELTGSFEGSSGYHTTTLQKCSCIDFNRRKLPCKHMYRLAMELECMESDFASNINDISVPSRKKMDFENVVEIIESLPEETQKVLLSAVRYITQAQPLTTIQNGPALDALLENNFFEQDSDNAMLLSHYGRNEINKRVQTLGIPFKRNMATSTLIDWCLNNIPEHIGGLFNDVTVVRFNPLISHRKVHQYLHRKFDAEYSPYYLSGEVFQEPLPNDNVTMLLRKYGHCE